MSEKVKIIDFYQRVSTNTTSASDIRIPTDEDDELLDFYMPPVVDDQDVANNPNIIKFISPYQEDAFTEEVLHEVVNSRLGFVVPNHLWEEINEAFAYYWDYVVGLNGVIYEESMFVTIREYLITDQFFCPDELLQEILTAIVDFIINIPGAVIQD